MRKSFFVLFLSVISFYASAQFVMTMEVKEPIAGICNDKEVYALLPSFTGQVQAFCPVSKEEILKRLNSEIQFLKDNTSFKGEGMIGLVINCKGKVVKCEMDRKTKNKELDKQIEAVFNTLGEWKAGTLNDREVDSSLLFSFKIRKGLISFD